MFIYLLKNNGKVVYVGKTKDVGRRIQEHKDKTFDDYSYIKCNEKDSSGLEDECIIKFDPVYNKTLNSKGEYKNLKVFCEENNLDIEKARKICMETPYIRPYFNENYNPYELNALKDIYGGFH